MKGGRRVGALVALGALLILVPVGMVIQSVWEGPETPPASDGPVPNPPLVGLPLRWRHAALPGLAAAGIWEISRLAAIGDRFVGFATLRPAGDPPQFATLVSDDGLAWLPVEGPINDVRVGGTTVVDDTLWAIGQSGPEEQPRHEIWTSADGVEWQREPNVSGLDFGPGLVPWLASDGKHWVAFGFDQVDVEWSERMVLASDDGREWQRIALPRRLFNDAGLAMGPTGFVIPFSFEGPQNLTRGAVWHSADGRVWTEHPLPDTDLGNVLDVAGGPFEFVVVGVNSVRDSGTPAAWRSVDGHRWEVADVEDPDPAEDLLIRTVAAAPGGFIAIGETQEPDTVIWRSRDGRAWEVLNQEGPPASDLVSALAADDRRVLVSGVRQRGEGQMPVVWIGTTD